MAWQELGLAADRSLFAALQLLRLLLSRCLLASSLRPAGRP